MIGIVLRIIFGNFCAIVWCHDMTEDRIPSPYVSNSHLSILYAEQFCNLNALPDNNTVILN